MAQQNQVSETEWERRVDLAAAFRFGAANWGDDILFEHMTARSPDNPDHTLMNDPDLLFEEMTASSLQLIDASGKDVHNPEKRTHAFSFPLHKSVYDAIPEAQYVIHSHAIAPTAVSMQKRGLIRNNQWAIWIGEPTYHEYHGFLTGPEEAKKLKDCFSKSQVTILRSHGMIVWGHSVKEAYFLAYLMHKACEVQIASGTGQEGVEPYLVSDEIIARTEVEARGTSSDIEGFNAGAWAALKRKAQRDFPGYDT